MLAHTILRPPAAQLSLPPQDVLRLLGYREGRTRLTRRDEELVERGMRLARDAAAPAASVACCAARVDGEWVRTGAPEVAWRSRTLARLLAGTEGVTLVAATLGPDVDRLIEELFQREEYALATVVDAAGSALVHGLAKWVRETLTGGGLTPLYAPGYGDWPVEEQIRLVELAGGPAIGVTCTPTCYLQPRKSLVGLFGWQPAGAPERPALGCSRCAKVDCPYRVRRAPVTGAAPRRG
ncbi:MAG: hypothetical protein AB2385_01540 [Symbiobacterium sp.]|uniref:hypothetical protein n=1 Tax=Symbiobacterium sp. TaxID=1971213 RepID=UPI0034644B70